MNEHQMILSIRDASRFVLGSALMRARVLAASPNTVITIDNVAVAALRENADGQKMRQSIETLATLEDEHFRSTPPHTLVSDKIVRSREMEIAAFATVGACSIAVLEHDGSPDADEMLKAKLVAAITAIEAAPGSISERKNLKNQLLTECQNLAEDKDKVHHLFKSAEQEFLAKETASILSKYSKSLDRSNDYDM